MHKLAIFASGSGSNAENIVSYFRARPEHNTEVSLILCNNPEAFVLKRAEKLGIPAVCLSRAQLSDADVVLPILRQAEADFLVLAGYLCQIPAGLVAAYPNAIVNIHPALIPKHCGKGMYGDRVHQAVVADGDTESGITIHYVNEEYDSGQIIFQAKCPVLPTDDFHAVAEKVHALEYRHFPEVIASLLK